MRDYRQYLKAVGRKPIKGPIRTQKKAGDVELCWHPEKGVITHVHEGPARLEAVRDKQPVKLRRAA